MAACWRSFDRSATMLVEAEPAETCRRTEPHKNPPGPHRCRDRLPTVGCIPSRSRDDALCSERGHEAFHGA